MDLRSYARVDSECTVPLQILKKTPEEGLQFELQSKSRQAVQQYLNGRPTQAALEQSRPYVQTQTEIEEAQIEFGLSGDVAVTFRISPRYRQTSTSMLENDQNSSINSVGKAPC